MQRATVDGGAPDLVVLAGGGARRLGGVDKMLVRLPDGRPVLAHVLAAPAGRRVVVGPRRDVAGVDVWTREDPPGGGPVAGLVAGLAHVTAAEVLVLAGDLPSAHGAVPALRAAQPGHDVAVVVADGRRQLLLALWDTAALRAALARVGPPSGAAVRRLFEGVDAVEVADGAEWSRDLDTPADLRRLGLAPGGGPGGGPGPADGGGRPG